MKCTSIFATAHLLLISVKGDGTVLVDDKQCNADGGAHCPDPSQDDNVSAAASSTEIEAAERDGTTRSSHKESKNNEQSTCGAYLAESSIPNAGLGVFTAKPIPAGEMLFNSEPVIQIEDINMHTGRRLRHDRLPDSSERPWLLSDYWLSSSGTMGSFEADDVRSVVPGLASACNYHPGLVNMKRIPPPLTAESDLHRSRDPGAGASTTYHGLHFVAKDDIPAGTELFEDYGESYFSGRKYKYANIPLSRDYEQANRILAQLDDITGSDFSTTSNLAELVWKMIWTHREEDRPIIKAFPESLPTVVALLKQNGLSMESVDIHFAKIYSTTSATIAQKAWEMLRNLAAQDGPKRILNALPKKLSDVPRAIELGTAKFSLGENAEGRSPEWLAEHGRCLDNIQPGKSDIPQAGYGAFATRTMKKGEIVAPVPVAQGNRKQMELYDALNRNDPNSRFFQVGKQLIINYAFGHPDSSLLLFPYSPVVNYINHNSSTYNVELQWSDLSAHQSDWLEKSPDELIKTFHAGLVLELVAVRDIQAGEEILIDYGSEWEAAWKNHVANWKPPKSASSYVQAAKLNARKEWLRTRAELIVRPYPDNVQTVCFVSGPVRDESEGIAGATDWVFPGESLYGHTLSAFPCQVWERVIREEMNGSHRRNDNQISHLARDVTMQELVAMDESESDELVKYNVKVFRKEGNFFMKGLPRRAIQFFDKAYKSDQFLRSAFRHEMHLPPDMVPPAWRDRIGEEESS